MTDDFWGPIYEKLIDNQDLLPLVCEDTSENDLFSWISPNPLLYKACKPFIKGKKLKSKSSCIQRVIDFAKRERALRKIILFNWIDKNQTTLKFATHPIDSKAIERLASGDFGGILKIKILSFFDPRPASKKLYDDFLMQEENLDSNPQLFPESSHLPPPLPQEALKQDNTKVLSDRIKELQENLKEQIVLRKNSEKENENLIKEVEILNKNLRETQSALKASEDLFQNQKRKFDSLSAQLEHRTKEVSDLQFQLLAKKDSTMEKSDFQNQLDSLNREISAQKKAIEIRDSKLKRLELELNQEKQFQQESDKESGLVERLKNRISNLEELNQNKAQKISGQIQLRITQKDGSKPWLFTSFSGKPYFIPDKLVKSAKVSEQEFCTIHINENNIFPNLIVSLEDKKDFKTGYLSYDNGNKNRPLLVTEENSYPIFSSVSDKKEGDVLKGTILPDFMERPFGVYSTESIEILDNKTLPRFQVSLKEIKNYFGLYKFDKQSFEKALFDIGVDFSFNNDVYNFQKDFKIVLPALRSSLSILKVCKSESCQAAAPESTCLALPNKRELCIVCNSLVTESEPQNLNFNHKSVLIFGGDRVGTQYKTFLEQFNLNIKWKSGFSNLGAEKSGLGKPDVILIVIKQISHTLLREIVPLANDHNIPVIFSPKRGLSGVLNTLKDYFLTK